MSDTERDPIYDRPSYPDWGACELGVDNDGPTIIEGSRHQCDLPARIPPRAVARPASTPPPVLPILFVLITSALLGITAGLLM